MAEFEGKFKLVSSENFDDFLKEMGVGFAARKIASAASPVAEITISGSGVYTIKMLSSFRNREVKFQLDTEFEEEGQDGQLFNSVVTKSGNKLIHNMKAKDGSKNTTILREFNGDEMKMVLTIGEVVCTRTFKRVD